MAWAVGNDLMLAAYALFDVNRHLASLTGHEMPPFPAFSDEKPEDKQKAVIGEKDLFSFWLLVGILALFMLMLPISGFLYRRLQIWLSLKKPRKAQGQPWAN